MLSRDYYKKQYYDYCDFLSSNKYPDDFLSYINSSISSKNFYNRFDYSSDNEESLYDDYFNEVKYVVNTFGGDNSDSIKLLNYLEYFRINCMYDNFSGINEKVDINVETPYKSAILGKGSCQSQTKFFLDILCESDFSSYNDFKLLVKDISFRKHYYISFKYNNRDYIIDPSIYNGTVRSAEQAIVSEDISSDILYDKESIKESRERVLKEFCNRHFIKKELFDLNKVMKNLISKCSFEDYLSVGSIEIDNKEYEIGKIFESICLKNDIYYNTSCIGDKRNTMYSVLIDNIFESINFKEEYRKERINMKFNNRQVNKN